MSFVGYYHATTLIIGFENFFASTFLLRCFSNNLKVGWQTLAFDTALGQETLLHIA